MKPQHAAWLATSGRFVRGMLGPTRISTENAGKETRENLVLRKGAQGASKSALRILSWNIMRNYRRKEISQTLRRLIALHDPDVILLQEVPVYDRVAWWELEGFLREFHLFYSPSMNVKKNSAAYNFRRTGTLTLARKPFEEARAILLPTVTSVNVGTVERSVAYVRIEAFGIYNIHLENACRPKGRWHQMRCLLDNLRGDGAEVLMGDFNTLFGPFETCLQEAQREGFSPVYGGKLDHALVKGAQGYGDRLSQEGSDHDPVLCAITKV